MAALVEHVETDTETLAAAAPTTGSGDPGKAWRDEESTSASHVAKLASDSGRRAVVTLALSFAILILAMVVVGWWMSWRIMAADAHLEKNLRSRTATLQMVYGALHYSSENSRIIVEILLQKNVSPELLAHRVENSNKITALISAIEANCDSDQERKLVATAKSTRARYVNGYRRALGLVDGKNNDLARAVVINEAAPAFFVYHSALEDIAGFELQQMGAATERATQHDMTTRRIGLALQWVAALLTAAIAVFTTCRIARDMRIRAHMQSEVSRLNAQLEQRVAERTRELGLAKRQLQASLAETRDYAGEIEAVNELAKLLQSCLTLDEGRQQAAKVLQSFFPSGAVLMVNASGNQLEVAFSWGTDTGRPGPFSPESCWALRKGETHFAGPHCNNPVCGHSDEHRPGCHLCIPMVAQGASVGVLSIDDLCFCNGRRQSNGCERRLKLAKTLAEQISLAFANLTLRETLKYQSVRDPLTGLFNRRYMEEALNRELLRAARKATPVSVVMLDIDHFKRFNDTHGHDAGDMVLREFGSLLRLQVRGGDFACRYGGEEFLLIMSETDSETACQRVETLRARVATMPVRLRGETLEPITLSMGVAEFPTHGNSADQMISAADGALYRAKREGRDRVVVAE